MKHIFGEVIVVALGGSIIFPDKIDWQFLRNFRKFLLPRLRRRKFVIVAGGGRLARLYQEAAHKVAALTDEDKDWIGIHATRANAHLLRTIFREVADPIVMDGRRRLKRLRYPITVASGWRPGWSTDYVAVQIAADFGAKEIVIAGTPAYVYDRDHAKYKTVHPLPRLIWKEYAKLIPSKWKPGLHAPVDPVAARLATKQKIKVAVINGKDLKNFSRLLRGKNFRGTMIE